MPLFYRPPDPNSDSQEPTPPPPGMQRIAVRLPIAEPRLTYGLLGLISRVAIRRSPLARLMSDDSADDSVFDDLDENDPRTMGRLLREMSEEMGEDMGPEFEEVVQRLERGEDPEEIEASLPDLGDDASPAPSTLAGDDDLP